MNCASRRLRHPQRSSICVDRRACQTESRARALEIARALREMSERTGVPVIYKFSYARATRTPYRFRQGEGANRAGTGMHNGRRADQYKRPGRQITRPLLITRRHTKGSASVSASRCCWDHQRQDDPDRRFLIGLSAVPSGAARYGGRWRQCRLHRAGNGQRVLPVMNMLQPLAPISIIPAGPDSASAPLDRTSTPRICRSASSD